MTPGWVADDSSFGARLALIRQRMGWGNVKEAALGCGLPVESWRGWERDGRMPRDIVTTCRRISDRTGCNLGWLIGMSEGGGVPAGESTQREPTEALVTPRTTVWSQDLAA